MCVFICICMCVGVAVPGRPGKGGKGLWACLEGGEWPLQGSEEALPSSAIFSDHCGSEAACYRGRKVDAGSPPVWARDDRSLC